jgi:3-oxoacyl-[acyl-carrier protein] reductase
MELEEKVSIITGGGRGIGRGIALCMAKEGSNIVIADINKSDAELVIEEIKKYGVNGLAVKVDITKISDLKNMKEFVLSEFGKIDILVNNAGIAQKINIEELRENDWDRILNVNLKGTFFCSQIIFSEMKKARYGKIINIASMAGERGGRFAGVNYSSSKAGVIVMTKCFALEGGPFGINVNAVAPGLINSEMSQQLNFSTSEIPLGRLGTPEEIGNLVIFLASEKSKYITGTTIDINGGIYMR